MYPSWLAFYLYIGELPTITFRSTQVWWQFSRDAWNNSKQELVEKFLASFSLIMGESSWQSYDGGNRRDVVVGVGFHYFRLAKQRESAHSVWFYCVCPCGRMKLFPLKPGFPSHSRLQSHVWGGNSTRRACARSGCSNTLLASPCGETNWGWHHGTYEILIPVTV